MNPIENITKPENKFHKLLQSPEILHNLVEKMGFNEPTPIQEAVIPPILSGQDMYAGAKTGSGKTVAFLAPLAQLLIENKINKALVLSPTRELALQIDDEAMKVFGENTKLVSIPLYGGVPLDQQLRALKIHNPRLYVATPGRMIDFISEGCLPLSEIEICVLDEADRMCDMGFSPQVVEILQTLPNLKQVLMFSATLPKEATDIMEKFLKNPVNIQVDSPTESNSSIEHRAYLVDRRHKLEFLMQLLKSEGSSVVVFVRTRKGADRLYDSLRQKKMRAGILHAGFSMGEREKTLRQYREEKIQCLVATDVAARGLDVDHVTHVVHYELPENVEDYIHRSGRSGRAGRKGVTIALVDKDSSAQKRQIESFAKTINIDIQSASIQTRRSQAEKATPKNSQKSSRQHSHHEKRSDQRQERNQKASQRHRPRRENLPQPQAVGSSSLLKAAKNLIGRLLGKKS